MIFKATPIKRNESALVHIFGEGLANDTVNRIILPSIEQIAKMFKTSTMAGRTTDWRKDKKLRLSGDSVTGEEGGATGSVRLLTPEGAVIVKIMRVVERIVAQATKVSVICSIIGYGMLFNLHRFTSGTEVDENALISPQYAPAKAFVDPSYPDCKLESNTTIIRAPRGDGREAIALFFIDACEMFTALHRSLASADWLAKDIVFISSDSHRSAVRLFDHTQASEPFIVRQVIVIDSSSLTSPSSHYPPPSHPLLTSLSFEGTNGLLPNQDWLNAFLSESGRAGLAISKPSPIFSQIIHSAFSTSPFHAAVPFINSNIPGFTIYSQPSTNLARAIESTVRAGNNLQQRLHHSSPSFIFSEQWSIHVIPGFLILPPLLISAPLFTMPFVKAAQLNEMLIPSLLDAVSLVGVCGLAVCKIGSIAMLSSITFLCMHDSLSVPFRSAVATVLGYGWVMGCLCSFLIFFHWALGVVSVCFATIAFGWMSVLERLPRRLRVAGATLIVVTTSPSLTASIHEAKGRWEDDRSVGFLVFLFVSLYTALVLLRLCLSS